MALLLWSQNCFKAKDQFRLTIVPDEIEDEHYLYSTAADVVPMASLVPSDDHLREEIGSEADGVLINNVVVEVGACQTYTEFPRAMATTVIKKTLTSKCQLREGLFSFRKRKCSVENIL